MTAAALDIPRIAVRFAQAGTGHAQAEVLREAFDAHEQALQEQARTLQVLQELVQKLQADASQGTTRTEVAEQARHQEERTDSRFDALRAEMATGFAKVDTRFAQADSKVELLNAKMDVGFAQIKADTALLRKDMEAMQNNLLVKLGSIMVLTLGALATIMKMFS